jgi:hypothetical protein
MCPLDLSISDGRGPTDFTGLTLARASTTAPCSAERAFSRCRWKASSAISLRRSALVGEFPWISNAIEVSDVWTRGIASDIGGGPCRWEAAVPALRLRVAQMSGELQGGV